MNYKIIVAALITVVPACLLLAEIPSYNKQAFADVLKKHDNLYNLETINSIIQELDIYVQNKALHEENVAWLAMLLLSVHDPINSEKDKYLYKSILNYCYQHGPSSFQEKNFALKRHALAIAFSNDTKAQEPLINADIAWQSAVITLEEFVEISTKILEAYDFSSAQAEIKRIIRLWKNNNYSYCMLGGLYATLFHPSEYFSAIIKQKNSILGLNKEQQKIVNFLKEALPVATKSLLSQTPLSQTLLEQAILSQMKTQQNNTPSYSAYDQELIRAICNGDKFGVQAALAKGANPDASISSGCVCNRVETCYCQNMNTLSVSAHYGADIEIIELLFRSGAKFCITVHDQSFGFLQNKEKIFELQKKYAKSKKIVAQIQPPEVYTLIVNIIPELSALLNQKRNIKGPGL